MQNIDLNSYLNEAPLRESLLINLLCDRSLQIVDIVYDYAAEVVSRHFSGEPFDGIREFRHLRFRDATCRAAAFRTTDHLWAFEELQKAVARGTICFVGTTLVRGAINTLECELSDSFRLTVLFSNVFVAMRKAVHIGDREGSTYRDLATGEPFDFFDPFNLNLSGQ